MIYGRIYSKISKKLLESLSGHPLSDLYYILALFYFRILGYPDIASHMRFKMINKYTILKNKVKLLDVGAGNGIYALEYADAKKIHAAGIEGRQERVIRANSIAKELGLSAKFFQKNLETVKLQKNSYDIILCLEVLEHIKKDQRLIKQIASALKVGGYLFITIPKYGKEGSVEFKTYQPFEHVRNGYSEEYFQEIAQSININIVEIKPYFLFFTKNMVRIQQYIFLKLHPIFNILTFPLLLLIAHLDILLPIHSSARGIFVVYRKDTL